MRCNENITLGTYSKGVDIRRGKVSIFCSFGFIYVSSNSFLVFVHKMLNFREFNTNFSVIKLSLHAV